MMQETPQALDAHTDYAHDLLSAACKQVQQQRRAFTVQHNLGSAAKDAAQLPAITTSPDPATMNCAHYSEQVSAYEMQLRALAQNGKNVSFQQRTFYGVQVGYPALVKSQVRVLLVDAGGFPAIVQFDGPAMKGNAKAKVRQPLLGAHRAVARSPS